MGGGVWDLVGERVAFIICAVSTEPFHPLKCAWVFELKFCFSCFECWHLCIAIVMLQSVL